MSLPNQRRRFETWILAELSNVHRSASRLLFDMTHEIKSGGLSRNIMNKLRKRSWSFRMRNQIFLYRPIMAPSSFYRQVTSESQTRVADIKSRMLNGTGVHLQWVDNYARFISRSSMFLDQEMFRQCYWTAHGVKVLAYFFLSHSKLSTVFRFWRP